MEQLEGFFALGQENKFYLFKSSHMAYRMLQNGGIKSLMMSC